MTAYKEIQGISVQTVAGDPPAPLTGQIWYNSSTGTFKVYKQVVIPSGAWSTGGNLNTARNILGGAGTQTSSLAFGGGAPSLVPTYSSVTETYNGTSWTEVNDLNTGRRALTGAGTDNTAALAIAGDLGPTSPAGTENFAGTESWNGTNWTEVNDLNTGRYYLFGDGTQTSALVFGGVVNVPPSSIQATTESWNGTNWTEVNDLNTARLQLAGAGADNTSALAFGGNPAPTGQTELWNGTNWTEVNDLNTVRQNFSGTGIQTAALAFGGDAGGSITGATETFNGTSWTEVNDLNTAREYLGGAGTQTAALAFGGQSPVTAATEEFDAPATISSTETITEV